VFAKRKQQQQKEGREAGNVQAVKKDKQKHNFLHYLSKERKIEERKFLQFISFTTIMKTMKFKKPGKGGDMKQSLTLPVKCEIFNTLCTEGFSYC
jgi:hypothetical protein